MATDAERLLAEALRLGREERAALAAALIESLDPGGDPELEAAWRAEVRRRCAELDDGSAAPVDWSEARPRIAGR